MTLPKMGEEIRVKGGRFKDEMFSFEGEIGTLEGWKHMTLPEMAMKGNWAAINALDVDKYKYDDAPFYYGKIGSLGYIISGKNLGIN